MNLRRYIYEHYIREDVDSAIIAVGVVRMLCDDCPIYDECHEEHMPSGCSRVIEKYLDMEVPDDFT